MFRHCALCQCQLPSEVGGLEKEREECCLGYTLDECLTSINCRKRWGVHYNTMRSALENPKLSKKMYTAEICFMCAQ